MRKLPKIHRAFYQLSDAKFIRLCKGVISSLTKNDNFLEISSELEIFKSVYETYFTSIPHRNIKNSVNTAIKNINRERATKALIKLSHLVAYYADFDIEALESSGFQLINKRQPKGQVSMAKSIELKTNGVEGMVIVQCANDENAVTYKARVSTDQKNWILNASSNRTVKIYNVPVGVPLYVQMQLENDKGFSPWSDSVLGMIPTQNLISSIHE